MMSQLLLCSLILAFATAIQSVVGFGLALFAVPLLVLAGLPLLPSVFVVLCVSCFSSLLGVGRLRGDFELIPILKASFGRMLGVIPGYALALYTAETSPATVKAAIGLAVGMGVVAQIRKMLRASDHSGPVPPNPRLAPLAFLSSGVLMGWLGMGGPPLVFWLLSGRQSARKTRAFLYGIYLTTIPFQLALMTYHCPSTFFTALPVLTVGIPTSLLAASLCLGIGDKLDVERLQKLSLLLLTLLATKAFFDWFQAV